MHLLVGLGNPGRQYKNNRHNIGFKLVDGIHSFFTCMSFRKKFQGKIAEGVINNEKIELVEWLSDR